MTSTMQTVADTAYHKALAFERNKDAKQAITQFRIAGDNGHLLAVLRLAQIFEEGTFGFAQDREKSERYFRSAATLPARDTSLHDVYRQSPQDGPIFIALMAKAFLIASESARYATHAQAALKYFFVLTSLNCEHLIDEPESFEALMQVLTTEQIDDASDFAENWVE